MSRLLRNMVSYAGGDAGSRLISFLVTAYLARVLGASSFGLVSIGLAVLGHLLLLSSPAIQLVETRNVAAGGPDLRERVGGVFSVRLLLATGLLAATAMVVFFCLPGEDAGAIVVLFALSLLPAAVTADWYFQGSERFATAGTGRVLQALVYGAVVVLLVERASDVALVPLAYLAGVTAAAIFLGQRLSSSPGRPAWRFNPTLWKKIIGENLPVGLSVFLAQQATNAPPLVIAVMLSTTDVGVYSAAARLLSVLLFVDRLLNALFLPAITRHLAGSGDEVKELLAAVLRTLLAALLPATALIVWMAPDLMELVFGTEFTGGGPVLMVLSAYALLTVLNSVFVCTLIGSGGERSYARIVAAGAGLLIVLLLVLTPAYGMSGAALAVAASEAFVLVWMARAAARRVPFPRATRVLRPVVAVPGLAAGPLLFPASPLLAAAAGIVGFSVLLGTVGGLTRVDLRLLRQL